MLWGEVDLTSLGDLGRAAQEKDVFGRLPDHASLSHLLDCGVGHQHSIAGKGSLWGTWCCVALHLELRHMW